LKISTRTLFSATFAKKSNLQQSCDKNILVQVISLNFGLVRYILSVRVLSTLFHGRFLSFFSEHLILLIFHLQNNTQMLKKQPKRKDLWTKQAFLSSKPIQETLVFFAFKSTFLADFTCFKVKCSSF